MSFDPSRILYEDNHLIIYNKKPGDIVQGDKTGDVPLLEMVRMYVKEKFNKPGDVFLGLIHRLDRPVSGIVMFARTSKSLTRMNELFQKRNITKTYLAIVKNTPDETEGLLTHYLIKNNFKNKSEAYDTERKGSSKAMLKYKVLQQSETFSLLEVDLLTGRHHQIRSQLGRIGCPIRGDVKYGFNRTNEDASINLHAAYVSFVHPVSGVTLKIKAPTPNTKIWNLFL